MENLIGDISVFGILFLMVGNAIANQLTMFANNSQLKETINNNFYYTITGVLGTLSGMFWAPIYLGLHTGWVIGIASFFVINFLAIGLGKIITLIGMFHLVFSVSFFFSAVGLYLTITTIP